MSAFVMAMAAGAFAWTLAEYVIHRFAGHGALGRNEVWREHLAHHARSDYFAPTGKKILVAAPVTAMVGGVASLLLGRGLALAFALSFAAAWAGYEVIHRLAHAAPPRTAYGRWYRRHHLHHHFHEPHRNHGVTSPLWDLVFGTYAAPGQVRVPARQAMAWLCDEHGVRATYARDYRL